MAVAAATALAVAAAGAAGVAVAAAVVETGAVATAVVAIVAAAAVVAVVVAVMQGNIWSVLRRPEPPIPMLFPSHFSSPQRFLFSLA